MNKRRRNRAKEDSTSTTKVVAWRIADWCKALSISRAQYYILLARGGIETLHLGTMVLVKTSPEQFLEWATEQAKAHPTPVKRGPGRRPRKVASSEPAAPAPSLAASPPGDDG
jgi:hypothetical protein